MPLLSHYPQVVSPIVFALTTAPASPYYQWAGVVPIDVHQVPPPPANRDNIANYPVFPFAATRVSQWLSYDPPMPPPAPTFWGKRGDVLLALGALLPVSASTPDQWTLYQPPRFLFPIPNRDQTASVRISGFEATPLLQWSPSEQRFVPPPLPRHEEAKGVQPLPYAGLATPDQWLPYGPTTFQLRPTQRDQIADVRLSGFEAVGVFRWQPYETHTFTYPPPQRDQTADVRLSGFEATPLPFWHPYEPHQVPPPPPQRDQTADVRISGFEAVGVFRWQPYEPHQVPPPPPQRDGTENWRFWWYPPTPPQQWLTSARRAPTVAWARRDDLSQVLFLAPPIAPATVDRWQPYEPTTFRLPPPRREAVAWLKWNGVFPHLTNYFGKTYFGGAYFGPRYYGGDVRLLNLVTPSISQWQLVESVKPVALRSTQRDQTADVRVSGFEAVLPIGQWLPSRNDQAPPVRPPQRDGTVNRVVWGFEAVSLDRWYPYEPTVVQLRLPQRDWTVHGLPLTPFFATPPQQWLTSERRVSAPAWAMHDSTAQVVTVLVPPAAVTPDRWHPYEPTTFQLRPPQRDMTADVRLSGFEAVTPDRWLPYTHEQGHVLPPPPRDMTARVILSGFEATTPDRWLPYTREQGAAPPPPQRDQTARVILSGFEAIPFAFWMPPEPQMPRDRAPSRDWTTYISNADAQRGVVATLTYGVQSYGWSFLLAQSQRRQVEVFPMTFGVVPPSTVNQAVRVVVIGWVQDTGR